MPISSADGVMATLTPEAFLRLFVTQVKHQDPTEPLDPSKMMSELAQMASLQQIQELRSAFSQALRLEELRLAEGIIGMEVRYARGDTEATGVVESASVDDGQVGVVVDGGFVPLDAIREIRENPGADGGADAQARP